MTFRKRFRLFFYVIGIVTGLVAAKFALHYLGAEFLQLDSLFPSILASSVFIIGFLLSSILPDYKEAERMPGEIRVALEAIFDDIVSFSQSVSGVDINELRTTLTGIVVGLEDGLHNSKAGDDLHAATGEIDKLTPIFAHLERMGMSQNFIVRLRNEQDVLRRCVYRIAYIQRMQFVPSVHVLIETLVFATLFLLLFLKTDGSYSTAIIFGFVSYLFVYALHLITVLEQPFTKGKNAVDDVSFFLLREFVDKIGRPTSLP